MGITVRALLALMDENERVGVFSRIRGFASTEDHLYRAWEVLERVDPSVLDAPVRSISRSLYDRINIEIE